MRTKTAIFGVNAFLENPDSIHFLPVEHRIDGAEGPNL